MINKVIRKISIGNDVNNQLHIAVDSRIGGHIVDTIKEVAPKTYEIWHQSDDGKGIFLWKILENMPVIIECNTRLE